MSSPFAIFRRHQRVLMVVVTGFAMISFVLLGAVQDPRNMPTTLVVLFLAAMAGGVAWLSGLRSGKASEYGITGVLIGALIGLAATLYTRDVAAVQMKGGNLTVVQLSNLRRQRYVANQFVQLAFGRTGTGKDGSRNQFEYFLVLPRYLFGFSQGDGVSTQDVVLGEVLRREADKMGLVITNDVVTEYIKELTGGRITAELFTEIRKQLQISEEDLLTAIKEELKARNAFNLLYGRNYVPPQTYWDFHRQLSVSASAELVKIPVAEFIDQSVKPSDAELQELFAQYRGNIPGYTPQGRREEGRPGFAQPRRLQLGYLEAVYDDIEPLMTPPTDEEIQAEYDRRYLRKVPESSLLPPELELPPGLDLPLPPPELPVPEKTEGQPSPEKQPSTESPASPDSVKPEPTPEKPSGDSQTDPAKGSPEGGEKSSSRFLDLSGASYVAFQGDATSDAAASAEEKPQPPAEPAKAEPSPAPAAAEAKPETPPADSTAKPDPADAPAEAKDSKPADGTPAPATDSAKVDPPPAPKSNIPPLDDSLKDEIRRDLLRQRTQSEIRARSEKAFEFLSEVSYRVQLLPEDQGRLTKDEATKKIEEYAQANNLIYVVTPLLSQEEFQESEDFPIARAISMQGTPQLVGVSIFQTAVTDLYRVGRADNFGTSSSYAYWKLADKEAYIPESLDDGDYVRIQVTKIWSQRRAAPKAEERAEKLAAIVRESGKAMSEALAEETVTGSKESLFLTVQETGEFSWMQRSAVPPNSFNQAPPIRRSIVNGADDAGDRFFEMVFHRLKNGEVGVVPNEDNSAFFVVRIKSVRPSTPEEAKKLKDDFIAAGLPPTFATMAQQSLREYTVNFAERLFEQYNVFIETSEAG